MKEGLLLYWIALHPAHIPPRHIEVTAAVVAHLAHTRLAIGNRALMATGVAPHAVLIVKLLHQLRGGFPHILIENLLQRGHRRASVNILVPFHQLRRSRPSLPLCAPDLVW